VPDGRKYLHLLALQITGLRASTNNRASTVLDMFIDAILEHGVPSKVRGDRGGENRDVSILMIILRASIEPPLCGVHLFSIQELSAYGWRWVANLRRHGERSSDDLSVFTFWTEAIRITSGFYTSFSWIPSTPTALSSKTTGTHIRFLVKDTTRVQT